MGFWLKVIGGLFAYNVAKKHIATKNDLKKLRQDLDQDKPPPFPEPSPVDNQYRNGRYGNWVTSTGQVVNGPQFYRPTMESPASNVSASMGFAR